MLTKLNANKELFSRRSAACPRGIGVMTEHFTDHAQNAEIWDIEGNRLVDFASGIAVMATGHRHPAIIAAVKQQLDLAAEECWSWWLQSSESAIRQRVSQHCGKRQTICATLDILAS